MIQTTTPAAPDACTPAPGVSIGLPVYNGAEFLRDAVDSLLAQTFPDFELILCDNASTDDTERICRDYQLRDPRVRYFRNSVNIGAAPNFNHTVELARGTYFKWAAHDDLCAPTFLERCVCALEGERDAVLAYPRAQVITADSSKAELYADALPTDADDPAVRFEALLRGHPCYEVFGLIRLAVLRTTPLIGRYAHGDGVLLSQLALRGRFHRVEEVLFFPRRHPKQSMSMLRDKEQRFRPDYRAYALWFDPRLKNRAVFPWWRMYWELLRSLFACPLPWRTRLRCCGHWAKWVYVRRRFFRGDVSFHLRRLAGTRRAS